jgi:isopentenyl diphosphate isomerase/L-lactate dehydrogenase-like FMN-dependent dehydrogenase
LILKGIVSSEDVILAHDSGVEALWISNHGGRQLDQCSSTLDSLVELSSLLQEKSMPVIFDGGVRRGSHVLTALILGADLVAVGRLPVYGLIYSGADGVKTIFENIEKELKTTMKLVGLTNLRSARDQLKQLLEKENDFALATIWDKLED